MKPFIQLILVFLCLFTLSTTFAQKEKIPRDTIYYQGTEKLNMLVLSKDYHFLIKDDQVQNILNDFQSRLKEIQENIPSEAYKIHYQYKKQIEILKSDKIKSFSLSDGKGLKANFQNRAILTDPSNNYQVDLEFDDIEEVLKADLRGILSAIVDELPDKDRHLRFLEYQIEPETNNTKLMQNRNTGNWDMLSLQAGVGANAYRNKFMTDLSGEIGLHLNHKGILRNQYYVSNNLMFSFDAENRAVINNFTNVGYRRNFSNQKDKSNWLGIELGTLTKQSGDIFKPNTMRLGINWEAGKHITVSPQLYFNGFFQQVSPGFRIGIGL
jgi:hypothetical protein